MKGDGHCSFRSIVQGRARQEGQFVNAKTEHSRALDYRKIAVDALIATKGEILARKTLEEVSSYIICLYSILN